MSVNRTQDQRPAARWAAEMYIPAALLFVLSLAVTAHGQAPVQPGARDPGVRGGAAGAGSTISGLNGSQAALFNDGQADFSQLDSVDGANGTDAGLGPRFNLDSCGGCHAHPAIGGSSPALNPQRSAATKLGATNIVPSFITDDGPVREVRFKSDGGVHALFTIGGRADAPGCSLAQPNFAAESAANNLSFRIPTPTFGLGLVEAISDTTILQNKNANSATKGSLGISGRENRNGNDGTITRFGWKAQNKSLLIFAAEAYNVEQGITNEAFPNERDDACQFTGDPEDGTDMNAPDDISKFAFFMRFLAPPAPVNSFGNVSAGSINKGAAAFAQIGCAICHTPTLTTGKSYASQLSGKNVNLFSDLLLHHMGSGLADGISQGLAGPDDFRTAPLWGLGQRIFFLHDGRTKDLVAAIQAHTSAGSEANAVVSAFNALPDDSRQNLLNFLRSL